MVYVVGHRFTFVGVGNDVVKILEQWWVEPHSGAPPPPTYKEGGELSIPVI